VEEEGGGRAGELLFRIESKLLDNGGLLEELKMGLLLLKLEPFKLGPVVVKLGPVEVKLGLG
jgi:hypothetical protein